ncbi:MAG TPA: glycosyl hydrolase family 18 protein [Longimicrobiales bacterium]|nr:glycosyl hydrolase family 18 protein [Longimicrobiales bacterium]
MRERRNAHAAVRLAVPFMLLVAALPSSSPAQTRTPEAIFYLTDAPDALVSFEAHATQVSVVAPQSYRVNARGDVEGSVPARVLAVAHRQRIPVMPLIVNPGWNLELFHTLLHDSKARARVIQRLVELGKQHGFWGWQFDFEQIHTADRDALTRFYRETAEALHAAGMKLSIAVYPDPDPNAEASPYLKWIRDYYAGAYDLKALADAGDFISLMTYLQHSGHTPPGPVGGLPYMERAVRHALALGVPAHKLSLGVPFFSMHWSAQWSTESSGRSSARGLSWTGADKLLREVGVRPEWDVTQGSNRAHWERSGQLEYVWIEDARALEPKLALQRRYGLRGISVWRIGQEEPAVWGLLKQWGERP